jgi:osmotically-inducible protein OsmY
MATDADLKRDVLAELDWDPAVKPDAIGVAVKDGVVTLTGHVDSFAQKRAAEEAVARVAGVKAIAVEIDVKVAPQHRRSDTEIAAAIEDTLRWNHLVRPEQLRVTVEHGHVTLEGEVEWNYERKGVENSIRPLVGVTGITNRIALQPQPEATDVGKRIEEALTRQAIREARHIEVLVEGHTVKLRGQVHSWPEREAAQGVAWSAPGVRTVINELSVV